MTYTAVEIDIGDVQQSGNGRNTTLVETLVLLETIWHIVGVTEILLAQTHVANECYGHYK